MNAATVPHTAIQTKVVQARNVSKVFKRDAFEVKALDDVSIEIGGGEFMALMGPSGSGKTTLLNMIAAIDRPTAGELLVLGENIFRFSDAQSARWRNEHIGFIFQSFNLFNDLTVRDNVDMPLRYRGLSAAERRRRADASLYRVGLSERGNYYPAELSGGQQQRVAIARALAGSPRVLLADEPTGNLDEEMAGSVMDLLQELHRDGITIVAVTHSAEMTRRAEREIRIVDGSVVTHPLLAP